MFILGPRAEPPVGSAGYVQILAFGPGVPDQLGALRLRGCAHQSKRSLRASKPRLTRGHLLLELIPVLLDALVVFDPLRLVVQPRERIHGVEVLLNLSLALVKALARALELQLEPVNLRV